MTRTSAISISMGKNVPHAATNGGVAIDALKDKGIVNDEVHTRLKQVHFTACEAKHEGWSSGLSYSAETFQALADKNIVDQSVYAMLKQINAQANKAKHDFGYLWS